MHGGGVLSLHVRYPHSDCRRHQYYHHQWIAHRERCCGERKQPDMHGVRHPGKRCTEPTRFSGPEALQREGVGARPGQVPSVRRPLDRLRRQIEGPPCVLACKQDRQR